MAETELEGRVRVVENKVVSIETKIDMFIGEIRQQNQMRAEEIRTLDAKIRELDIKTDARIARIESKFDGMGKHVRNLTVAAIVGMGTMTIAGIAIAISIVLK